MRFLRRQAFYLVCGVAAATGVALGVTGLRAMPRVIEDMEASERLYNDLGALSASPVNQRAIEAERDRIEKTLADHERILDKTGELNRYHPLVSDTFPNGNDQTRREFQRRYGDAMRKLFASLHAGQPATKVQIDEMEDKVEDEQLAPKSELDAVFEGAPRTGSGVLTKAGARMDPVARAHMAAAQKIYCYATPFARAKKTTARGRGKTSAKQIPSLDFDPMMIDVGAVDAPLPEDVWRAQVSHWIQKDVVDAIAAINEERADEVRSQNKAVWVGIMPVKEVISIRVAGDYVLPDGDRYDGAEPGGFADALPPSSVVTAFTQSASSDLFEVKQFSLKLIMDQRDIPRLIDRLCNGTFHTLLRVAYKAVPPNKDMRGKIYGFAPVVNVVMDFETVMLGDVFRPLMPETVCQQLADEGYGIECPETGEEEGDG